MVVCHSYESGSGPAHSLVIAAGGGRDLAWPHQRVAAELLARSGGRPVHLVLHGGARGADAAIGRAAHQLGWSSLVMPAHWQLHGRAAGPIRNRELLKQAIARAVAHTSPGHHTSVLVVAFPGGAGTASLVQQAHQPASGLFLSPPAPEAFRAIGRSVCLRSIHSLSPSWLFSPPSPPLRCQAHLTVRLLSLHRLPQRRGRPAPCSDPVPSGSWASKPRSSPPPSASSPSSWKAMTLSSAPQLWLSWRRHSLQKGATKRPWVAIAQPRAISSMRALH